MLEIPDDIFVSIFALARIPGWTAQVTEQLDNNILIRPLLEYVGELDIPYIDIDELSSLGRSTTMTVAGKHRGKAASRSLLEQ